MPDAQLLLVSRVGGIVQAQPHAGDPYDIYVPDAAPGRSTDPGLGDPDCPGPPARDLFEPSALALMRSAPNGSHDGGRSALVAAVNRARSTIELLRLPVPDRAGARTASLVWCGCVRLPPDLTAADLSVDVDGGDRLRIIVAGSRVERWLGAGRIGSAVATVLGWLGAGSGAIAAWRSDAGRWSTLLESPRPTGVHVDAAAGVLLYADAARHTVCAVVRGVSTAKCTGVHGEPGAIQPGVDGVALVPVQSDSWRGRFLQLRCALGRNPCDRAWAAFAITYSVASDAALSLHAAPIIEHGGFKIGAVTTLSFAPATSRHRHDLVYAGSAYGDRIGVVALAKPLRHVTQLVALSAGAGAGASASDS